MGNNIQMYIKSTTAPVAAKNALLSFWNQAI